MTTDNYEKYEAMLTELSDESGRMAWSSGSATLFYVILLIILLTVVAGVFFPSINLLIMLFILVVEVIALTVPLIVYHRKAGIYKQDRCLELDRTHPGIHEAYEEWKRRIAEKSISS